MLYEGTHFQSLYQGHPQICGNGLEYEKNTQTKPWPLDSLFSWVSSFLFYFLRKSMFFHFCLVQLIMGMLFPAKQRKKSA